MIKTERLEIRPFAPEDRAALSRLLTNEEIKKTFILPDFATPEALGRMLDRFSALSLSDEHFVRGIYSESGLIGFVNDVELEGGCIELGYVIHPACWGRGYATEMLAALICELGKRFSVIRTGAFIENAASIRVMEKCGMRKTARRDTVEYRGAVHSCVYYETAKGG